MRERASKGKVVFVGWSTALPVVGATRLCPSDLPRASLAGCSGVVLGASAVATLDPFDTAPLLTPLLDRVVLCVESGNAASLWPWATLGFRHVPPERIAAFLAELVRCRPRPLVSTSAWLERIPEIGTQAHLAAAVVSSLDTLRVKSWAAHLQWPRDRLLHLCEREFGMTAKSVLRRYVVAACREMRREGATWSECAEVLGYCDSTSLRHALKSRASTPQNHEGTTA